MTFSRFDFLYLRWCLLVFLLVLGLGGILIVASKNFTEKAQRDRQEAQRQLREARIQLATAEADRENMRDYMLEYNALLSRNVIGNDRRLDWVEGLSRISRHDKPQAAINFTYSILPQKAFSSAPVLDGGNFEINRSDMALQFDLLHEGQLITFFDMLRSDISGWYILDKCVLERSVVVQEGGGFGVSKQLRAECAGGWITLRDRRMPK